MGEHLRGGETSRCLGKKWRTATQRGSLGSGGRGQNFFEKRRAFHQCGRISKKGAPKKVHEQGEGQTRQREGVLPEKRRDEIARHRRKKSKGKKRRLLGRMGNGMMKRLDTGAGILGTGGGKRDGFWNPRSQRAGSQTCPKSENPRNAIRHRDTGGSCLKSRRIVGYGGKKVRKGAKIL